jgi:putative endonuclease
MKKKKNPLLTGRPAQRTNFEAKRNRKTIKALWAKRGRKQGRRAEHLAAWLLRLKFYRIVGRNIRLPGGEIDIIARRGALLVFVEVKSRRSLWLARQAVSQKQWRRIEAAAGQFVAARPALRRCRWRFDVIAQAPWRAPRHIINAWRSRAPH